MAVPTFPTFKNTAGTITITFPRGRTLDSGEEYEPNQIINESGAGYPQVADMGRARRFIDFKIQSLTQDEYDDLIDFFEDVSVRWSGKTFTFTDESEVAHTVNYWGGNLRQSPTRGSKFDISIILRVE
jgi:hypothetical protein